MSLPPYGIPTSGAHAQQTSTGTANVQTLSAPVGARGVYLTARTNIAYMVWDGTTPSSTNGLELPAAGTPVYLPIGKDIKFASAAAGNAIVNALWLA